MEERAMFVRERRCARPGCGEHATAAMSYHYANSTVWLDSPGREPDPDVAWGLCTDHADRLKVPVGWTCKDRRSPVMSVSPPLAG